ncbi:MAG TPA: geranylgeranylglyceryl/heptaprenylglyceryl phosphate synthase [Candidatus Acidoferrum sp.]|nr:geranylgeranylglyceryl/heptaprenylglyceryl phosphate synthase [Candidatus Acidoferrum sp.]
MATVLEYLLDVRARYGGGFLLLLDPDRLTIRDCTIIAEAAGESGVDAILVGSSLILNVDFAQAVRQIKDASGVPVIILPGSVSQVVPDADAILFTSLLSSRNPIYLVDEQVKGAPLVKRYGLEPIPTAYLLIESGRVSSAMFMSAGVPIPRNKPDIACAHALAGQYMGMKLVYLEAGSGADLAVPVEMIREVAHYIDIPIIVGGGLKSPEDCLTRIEAGASFVVMGNHFETPDSLASLREMVAAAHPKAPVNV